MIFSVVVAIIFILFEVVFFILLFINPNLIGELDDNHIDISYHFIVMVLLVLIVITVLVTGLMIAYSSAKSNIPEISLKGKLLGLTFLFWSVCATIDAVAPLRMLGIAIIRTVLIINSFFFFKTL